MAHPKVSVVMSVLNEARYIAESITSVLTQTCEDLELIVVDDGSSDESVAIVNGFAAMDSRVVPVHSPQRGLVAASNAGCALAKADLIARLDGDDLCSRERLEIQLAGLAQNTNVALLGTAIRVIDKSSNELFQMVWPTWQQGLKEYLLMDCCVSHTSVVFRKKVFEQLGGYRSAFLYAEDYDFFLRVADRNVLDNSTELLCAYRLHELQVSQTQVEQQVLSAIGARLATSHRRAGRSEPLWSSGVVEEEDLRGLGIAPARINSLLGEYIAGACEPAKGWRWKRSPFYTAGSQ